MLPLTAGERAAAGVIAEALRIGHLRCELDPENAERERLVRKINSGNPDDRPLHQRRLGELLRAEELRREVARRVLLDLVDVVAVRNLVARFEHAEHVRVPILAARKAARADERDLRRAAKNGVAIAPPAAPTERNVETSAPDLDTGPASAACDSGPKVNGSASNIARTQAAEPRDFVAEAKGHLRLRGLISSQDLAAVLRELSRLAAAAPGEFLRETALEIEKRRLRDAAWLEDARGCVDRAAAGPPTAWRDASTAQQFARDLRWLSVDTSVPELATAAAALLQDAPHFSAPEFTNRAAALLQDAAAARGRLAPEAVAG